MQEHFQYREVGKAEAQRRHASNSVLLDRVGSLPQHKPDPGCRLTFWIGSDCDDNSSDLVARLEEAVSLNDLVEREYTGDCRHERAV